MTDLGNRYALSALKDKRATLAGEIVVLQRKLSWATRSLKHLDATLMLLEPTGDPKRIPPKRAQKRIKLFRQGQLSALLLDILRKAKQPLSTYEIVSALLITGGHGEGARPALGPRVRGNLSYLESIGRIAKLDRGRLARWTVQRNLKNCAA